MPKREDTVTVHGGPQGEDAWITVKYPTVDVHRSNMDVLNSCPAGSAEIEQAAREMFSQYVIDWNWVNGEGTPLPKPHRNPATFGALLQTELNYMSNVIGGKIVPPPKPTTLTQFLEKMADDLKKKKK